MDFKGKKITLNTTLNIGAMVEMEHECQKQCNYTKGLQNTCDCIKTKLLTSLSPLTLPLKIGHNYKKILLKYNLISQFEDLIWKNSLSG